MSSEVAGAASEALSFLCLPFVSGNMSCDLVSGHTVTSGLGFSSVAEQFGLHSGEQETSQFFLAWCQDMIKSPSTLDP